MVNTKFWSDSFIVDLNPLDRYLFLYFITNEHTNICGIYELPLKVISNETGIEKDMVEKMIKRLRGKISYIDGWVCIHNFINHQQMNDKVKRGIELGRKSVPEKIWLQINNPDRLSKTMDSVPKESININSNSNLNSNLKISTPYGEVWEDFLKYRKQKKDPMTEIGSKRLLTKLSKFDKQTAIAMLEQSMEQGWKGVFEVDQKKIWDKKAIQELVLQFKHEGEPTPRYNELALHVRDNNLIAAFVNSRGQEWVDTYITPHLHE